MIEGFKSIPLVFGGMPLKEHKERLIKDCEDLTKVLNGAVVTWKKNCILAGRLLTKIENEGLYRKTSRYDATTSFLYGDAFLDKPFYKFCERYFNLSEKTVYTLQKLYQRFGGEDGSVIAGYSKYGYSQLVEMAPMTIDELNRCRPEMTVKELRAIKKVKKEEPKKEEEKKEETFDARKCVFEDIGKKKADFKIFVKQFFEKYDYKLTLNGRGQGGQAFGGVLFEELQRRGFFNADKATGD